MKNWLVGLTLACALSACVTINIYFPAAAAEKAADKIIDDVWQLKDGETPSVNTVEPQNAPAANIPSTMEQPSTEKSGIEK